jgi:hypothetical protein
MVEARRRPTFHTPGEPLQVTASPLEPVERFGWWLDASGMAADDVLVTPIVTTPLPIYPAGYPEPGAFGGTRRRWSGVRPEFMWHPLMWLPRRVALRYSIADPDNPDLPAELLERESDDAWAVRVTMELASAGLYSIETGEWLDVLSGAGLDIDNDADLARVEEWLDGAPDPILDAIDLAPILDDPERLDWAFGETALWMSSLKMMLWATHSESLLDSARRLHQGLLVGVPADDSPDAYEIGARGEGDFTTPLVPLDPTRARTSAAGIAFFGSTVFSDVDPEEKLWWDVITETMAEATSTAMPAGELADGPVLRLVEHLGELVEDFVPPMEDAAVAIAGGISQFADAPADVDGPPEPEPAQPIGGAV